MKLLFSNKADMGTELPFKIIIGIIVLLVVIFIIIPLIINPLQTDPCNQQNGIRTGSCDEDVSIRNNFIEPDETGRVCCIAQPGKKEEFQRWSDSIAATTSGTDRKIVLLEDITNFNCPDGNIGLYLHKDNDLNSLGVTSKTTSYPTNYSSAEITPQEIIDIVGINEFADGTCSLTIRKASRTTSNTTYHPLSTAQGTLLPPEPGFDYEKTNCKKGTGVQITGKLAGLAGDEPYYLLTYAVKSSEKNIQQFYLLKSENPNAADTEAISSDTISNPLGACTPCSFYKNTTTCNADNALVSECNGCYWTTSETCVDCTINECRDYGVNESCIIDSCAVGDCEWGKKTCFDCDDVVACGDYPDKIACEEQLCPAELSCKWKTNFFKKNECVLVTS
ncbi:hypothetical protein K9M74_02515 [Candidatus Woesearchaeota archaeon]|nr:hypothetical protein [Candidatus Woesearchaeota archaeon]